MPIEYVTVYECLACECRGNTPDTIWHSAICADPSESKPIEHVLGSEGKHPLF